MFPVFSSLFQRLSLSVGCDFFYSAQNPFIYVILLNAFNIPAWSCFRNAFGCNEQETQPQWLKGGGRFGGVAVGVVLSLHRRKSTGKCLLVIDIRANITVILPPFPWLKRGCCSSRHPTHFQGSNTREIEDG